MEYNYKSATNIVLKSELQRIEDYKDNKININMTMVELREH